MIRNFLWTLFAIYTVNFGIGYFVAKRNHPAAFCRNVIGQAHGWGIAAILVAIPGEANACLDLGYLPSKEPPFVLEPESGR